MEMVPRVSTLEKEKNCDAETVLLSNTCKLNT